MTTLIVIPAQAGIQCRYRQVFARAPIGPFAKIGHFRGWIPACAGMTSF